MVAKKKLAPPTANEQLLLAASAGDVAKLRSLLTSPSSSSSASEGSASTSTSAATAATTATATATATVTAEPWYESPDLGWSALHFAAENGHTEAIRYLLQNGAIWNAVDIHGVTAGEVAWSCNWIESYNVLFEEGVRQTVLLNTLEELEMAGEDEDEDEDEVKEEEANPVASTTTDSKLEEDGSAGSAQFDAASSSLLLTSDASKEVTNSNTDFLSSPLRFFTDAKGKERCLDVDDNMVMSGWETGIMKRSAEILCQSRSSPQDEFKVLNVGFGLGIIDDFLESLPSSPPTLHVIIEPHPDAIAYFHTRPISSLAHVRLVPKTWQDFIEDSDLLAELGEFDAIYADPFAQDYKDLKKFFEFVPNLLKQPGGCFGFFHGTAGTNRFFYDVYTRITELDLLDIGFSVEWESVPVEMEDKEEVWKGVKRKYWTLDEYRLPICKMDAFAD